MCWEANLRHSALFRTVRDNLAVTGFGFIQRGHALKIASAKLVGGRFLLTGLPLALALALVDLEQDWRSRSQKTPAQG